MASDDPTKQRLLDSADDRKRHTRATVDAATRMRLNGESAAQMEHAEAIKRAGGVSLNAADGSDTSKDQAWQYDESCSATAKDRYVLITTVLWLGPKILIMALPMLALHLLPCLVARLYVATMPDRTESVVRSCSFYLVYALFFLLGIPAWILAIVSLLLDYMAYYFFSLLYCALTCRWLAACRSSEKIRPYRNGPSILLKFPDLFVCIMGQHARQAIGETTYMVSCMWLLMPWLKYYVNCNPFIYDLDHRLCQQITTTMGDLGSPPEVAETARHIISRCRQDREMAHRIDLWSFVPHYPYPPPNRRWALGLQAGGAKYPGKFTLIVHTTHAVSDAGGSAEQLVVSNCVEEPIYRVMLWYSNPYHFLTGWVEASVSNGMPSQPDKRFGGEHPMWLVTGRTPMIAGRGAFTGSGMIDAFFDYWLPVFVHEMRYHALTDRFGKSHEEASEAADRLYQEVNSKDGVSRPILKRGLDEYQTSAMRDMDPEADKRHEDESQRDRDDVMSLDKTSVGHEIYAASQGTARDLHAEGGCLSGV